MNPILLATDGSPAAEAATDEALRLAHALDAPLLAVGVAHVVVPGYAGFYGYAEIVADMHRAEKQHVADLLARVEELAAAAGVACETAAFDGPVASQICRTARDHDARFIVIGSHGWGGINRLVHGSVSTDVLHQASCPVHVVHEHDAQDTVSPVAGTEQVAR
jgi:nucleotide-binding universal stress UspA family protein